MDVLQQTSEGPSDLFVTDGIEAVTVTSLTVGSRVIVAITHGDRTVDVTSVTDNGSNTYSENGDFTDNSATFSRTHFWSAVVTTAATTITVTLGSADPNANAAIAVWEVTLPDTGTATDGSTSTVTTDATSFPSGNIVTTVADVLLVGLTQASGTVVADGAYTSTLSAPSIGAGYRLVTTTGTYSMTNTADFGDGFTALVAYRGVAGGGGGSTTAGIRIAPQGFA